MATILGISGSLRRASINRFLLVAAREVAPDGATIVVEDVSGVPLYNGDDEASDGVPGRVTALKEALASADGLLLVTPEYNGSIPGVFKNAIDWMSRPPKDMGRVFRGKPVGVIGATPGRGGTISAQNAWLQVLRGLGMVPFFGKSMYLSSATELFGRDGALRDDPTRERLAAYIADFADFIAGGTR